MKRKQYPQPESDTEMVKEPIPSVSYNHSVSPLDALWSIYQSQSKRVRKATVTIRDERVCLSLCKDN